MMVEEKIELNKYQKKQMKYVKELESRIKKNHWEPMDLNLECRTCKLMDHVTSIQEVKDFMEKHANHFTWVVNNHQPTPVTSNNIADNGTPYDNDGTQV